ncbi:hypothetical protein [uncultured Sphingomonas sp.]|jgi:hypothetical protein|uniref:hypothetical protein n=1 Tax=uncultured Sphingomonas sp. TaxID=158754 RepID=UPI0035CA60F8
MITDSDRRRVAILILGLHAIRREQFKAYSVLDHPLEILLNLFVAHAEHGSVDRTTILTIGNSNPAVTGRWLNHLEGVSHIGIEGDRVKLRALGLAAVRSFLGKSMHLVEGFCRGDALEMPS